jgi:choline dehydrogenase-like flavoprotein
VLPYFIRAEDDIDYGDKPYHGRAGPTPVVRRAVSAWGQMDNVLATAALGIGHAWQPDHNAPDAFGVSRTAMNIRMGVRVTTNDGYLEPARERPHLRIIGEALVDRVLLAGTRAVGVRARIGGRWQDFRAQQVVLCAGAASSPAILQRSGVGPARPLRALGIRVVADLPVGAGIQDHVGFWLSVGLGGRKPAGSGARGNCTLRYTSGTQSFGAGDLLMTSANPLPSEPGQGAVGVKLAQCFSRGSLVITSRDPSHGPAIQLGLLTDQRDRVQARRILRDALELLRHPTVASQVTDVRDRHGGPVPPRMPDSQADEWIRAFATDTSHLSCGARMGRPGAATTVVDPGCRVLGTDSLWVADMSIAPAAPRANTHLTAVMIGERAADLIA